MRIGAIVARLRNANTTFGNFIGGSAELAMVQKNTLTSEMCFVIPLGETAEPNKYANTVEQKIYERFGVIVALKNDYRQEDKDGFLAYDRVHDIRTEFFTHLITWTPPGGYDVCSYVGGSIVDMNRAWFWYQYEFQYASYLDGKCLLENDFDDTEEPTDFNTLYTNFILAPSADLPHTGTLPLEDGFPNVRIPDQAQWIDFTNNPDSGAYGGGFASAFKLDLLDD